MIRTRTAVTPIEGSTILGSTAFFRKEGFAPNRLLTAFGRRLRLITSRLRQLSLFSRRNGSWGNALVRGTAASFMTMVDAWLLLLALFGVSVTAAVFPSVAFGLVLWLLLLCFSLSAPLFVLTFVLVLVLPFPFPLD